MKASTATVIRWCFYALFPGFFGYHYLVALQWLPPVLGGYSSAMAALLLLPLGLIFSHQVLTRPNQRSPVDLAFIAFVTYYAAVMLMQMAVGARSEAAPQHFGVMVQFLSLYFAVRLIPLDQASFQRWLLVFLLAMSAVIVLNADEGTFVVASLDLLWTEDYFATYQAYGFVYLVTLLLLLSPIRRFAWRLPLYLLAIPTLFLNGARTEFVGVLILVLVLEFLMSRHKLLVTGVAVAVIALSVASLPLLADLYPESRTVLLFLDYGQDISANERAQMLTKGWQTITENPLLGALGSHPSGEHIHNGLSAWVDLGLIGFIAYALLIAVPSVDLLTRGIGQLRDWDFRLAFCMLFLTALFALTSKHYTHQLLPIALAVYARLQVRAQSQPKQVLAATLKHAP
jgi:O-antigen ligase